MRSTLGVKSNPPPLSRRIQPPLTSAQRSVCQARWLAGQRDGRRLLVGGMAPGMCSCGTG
eukprot:10475638-Alexandrium_andersonii.AAC.1